MKNIVWHNVLDKKYQIEVERTDDFSGELRIFEDLHDTSNIIYREKVALSYRAMFDPDINEVSVWKDKCIKFIDSYVGLSENEKL